MPPWSSLEGLMWVLYVFFAYFFYYSMVFLVASSLALWYYKKEDTPIVSTVFKWYLSAIGPITFASLVITILKAMKSLMTENSSNPCMRFCFSITKCIFAALEFLIKILNHYAIISMAFTGEAYYDSAKRAGVLLFDNTGLFAAVDIITGFFFYSAIWISVGVPSIIGLLVLNSKISSLLVTPYAAQQYELIYGNSLVSYLLLVIVVFSVITCIVIVSMFTEAINATVVFFCMDRKLHEFGIVQHNAPD